MSSCYKNCVILCGFGIFEFEFWPFFFFWFMKYTFIRWKQILKKKNCTTRHRHGTNSPLSIWSIENLSSCAFCLLWYVWLLSTVNFLNNLVCIIARKQKNKFCLDLDSPPSLHMRSHFFYKNLKIEKSITSTSQFQCLSLITMSKLHKMDLINWTSIISIKNK